MTPEKMPYNGSWDGCSCSTPCFIDATWDAHLFQLACRETSRCFVLPVPTPRVSHVPVLLWTTLEGTRGMPGGRAVTETVLGKCDVKVEHVKRDMATSGILEATGVFVGQF